MLNIFENPILADNKDSSPKVLDKHISRTPIIPSILRGGKSARLKGLFEPSETKDDVCISQASSCAQKGVFKKPYPVNRNSRVCEKNDLHTKVSGQAITETNFETLKHLNGHLGKIQTITWEMSNINAISEKIGKEAKKCQEQASVLTKSKDCGLVEAHIKDLIKSCKNTCNIMCSLALELDNEITKALNILTMYKKDLTTLNPNQPLCTNNLVPDQEDTDPSKLSTSSGFANIDSSASVLASNKRDRSCDAHK